MKKLTNIENSSVPSRIVMKYINLYQKVGRGEKDIESISDYYSVYHNQALKNDIKSLFHYASPDARMTETREKSIINGTEGIVCKTNDEVHLRNLCRIFDSIYGPTPFEFVVNEIKDLEIMYSKDTKGLKTGLKKAKNGERSYYDRLNDLIEEYVKLKKEGKTERIYLNVAFFVDFLKLSPFEDANEIIALILFYVMILGSDIKSFAYISFFSEILESKDILKKAISQSFYMYDEGLSDTTGLLSYFLDIMIKSYDDLSLLEKNRQSDTMISKFANVENIIYKLNETFTKNDIRDALPSVSDSTIDRVLKKMQDEGKIAPLGRGRGASWVRLDTSYDEKKKFFENFK